MPDSTEANPRCMMKTSAAEIRIQRLSIINFTSFTWSTVAGSAAFAVPSNRSDPSVVMMSFLMVVVVWCAF